MKYKDIYQAFKRGECPLCRRDIGFYKTNHFNEYHPEYKFSYTRKEKGVTGTHYNCDTCGVHVSTFTDLVAHYNKVHSALLRLSIAPYIGMADNDTAWIGPCNVKMRFDSVLNPMIEPSAYTTTDLITKSGMRGSVPLNEFEIFLHILRDKRLLIKISGEGYDDDLMRWVRVTKDNKHLCNPDSISPWKYNGYLESSGWVVTAHRERSYLKDQREAMASLNEVLPDGHRKESTEPPEVTLDSFFDGAQRWLNKIIEENLRLTQTAKMWQERAEKWQSQIIEFREKMGG